MSDTHPILDTLNDSGRFKELDPKDMLGLVLKFPRQSRQAVAIAKTMPAEPAGRAEICSVVITGLGGSAIGGDFARVLMEDMGTVPVVVNRDYTLPNFVGPNTLVMCGSYSGNTEETLSAYAAAKKAGAQIAVVTSGGKIAQLAKDDGNPVIIVPGGQPPRSATGYMFFPLIAYLAHRGLFTRDLTPDIAETLDLLDATAKELGPDVPTGDNPAKQMAVTLQNKIPVIYGSQGYRGAVAYRWKCQFNENTKVAAFSNVFPEQNHNEILAWVQAPQQAQNWATIFLRDPFEKTATPRIARRVEVTEKLIDSATEIQEVWAKGESLLARMFTLIFIADFITVYLAYLYGVCPTDIGSIDHLKAEMDKLK